VRRPFLTKLLVTAAAFALACTSDRSPLPTQPQPPAYSTSSFPRCDVVRVAVLIKALYPLGSARNVAMRVFIDIQSSLTLGKTAIARAATFAFIKVVLADLTVPGKLLVVTPPIASSTSAAVSELVTLLYQCLGVTAPTIDPAALTPQGAAAVVVPSQTEQVVATGDHQAGVSFPGGSVTQPLLVTIHQTVNQTNPLPTTLNQFPPFYDFATFPDVPLFQPQLTVGICVSDAGVDATVAARLQLAHPDRATTGQTLEILAKPETPPGFITCTTPAPSPGPLGLTLTGWKGIAKRVADRAVTLFLPPLLHAGSAVRPGGLGGLTSNFSPFGAVDPSGSDFQGTWNGTITPLSGPSQPVTLIVTTQGDGAASGEFRVAAAGGTQAYNQERFWSNGQVTGGTLAFTITPFFRIEAAEFSFTRSGNNLSGTATEVITINETTTRTPWAASLSLGTTALVSPPPPLGLSPNLTPATAQTASSVRTFGQAP